MSNSNTTQENLEIMKESEKQLVEESLHKNKLLSRSASKEGMEKESEESNVQADPQRRTHSHGHGRKRTKSNSKMKLVRSLAVCEESSNPFSVDGSQEPQELIQLHISCPSDKEEEKSSKDESEKEEREKSKEKTPRKMLSRDSSQEYTDSTGIDVHEFLVNTLKNNPRDRMMLLKLEQDILEFINDNNNQYKKFPQMTSYHRMLLHRVAAYFGMDHNVDQTGKAVIINKTCNTRIPEQRFTEHIKDERNVDFQKKFILKRDDASMDKDENQIRVPLQDGRRSKSIEEREEEYQRARDRIFARESSQNGYIADSRLSKDGYSSSSQKRRQIFRGNRDSSSRASSSRQSSTDSELKCLEPRPWSSTDSDSSNRTLRPPVTKASSFSGISILTRGDSIGSSRLPRTDACTQPLPPGRSLLPCSAQQAQPAPSQTALLSTPQQPPLSSHLMAQPVPALQPSPQPVQYSASSCPQVLLPVSPPQQYNMAEDLNSQFTQMTLSRQGSSEAAEPPPALYPPSAVLTQHAPQANYIMATSGQPISASGYQPGSAPAQSVLQAPPPQSYLQPAAAQQIQVSYYPPGQYPSSSQQFRALPHQVSYTSQRNQQVAQPTQQTAGLQPMMQNQQQAYQGIMGVQQPQNPSLMNGQRGNINNQMQGMMVQYPPLSSYQVPVANDSQQVVPQSYQQPVMVPASQSVQGGAMPVYYSVLPPAQQTSTSPSVGFLQPPGAEQYPIPQSPSPCNPPPVQQQYSGVAPPGPGMVVMQLSIPNGPQTPQNPSMVQWNHCKYYGVEQRAPKAAEVFKPENGPQVPSNQMSSPLTSPTQSPTPSPSNSVCTGLGPPLPLIAQFPRPVGPAQGDGRYSLLGQPLQYSLCPPTLLHGQSAYSTHQGHAGVKHSSRGKRQTLKSASTDLGTTDVVVSRILEVTDLPEGITRTEAEKLFNQLAMSGAKIQWLKDGSGGGKGGNDPANLYTVVAVFPSTMAAQSASFKLNNSSSRFKLRAAKKNYDLRVLERASSQ
ncbi:R3H domain-containing protein 2 isoform X4 [Erpetoichthys calabaricus]|uniref:R3H domain-containing protein 2 isoform X4 n=1 Tax=Erpetoichthys calabaricus TaxID=27687 RepID=UPI0010A0067B|nr:R3H domain-containing protein 2 isoform X4 [Erpetoichthys calabaricus]